MNTHHIPDGMDVASKVRSRIQEEKERAAGELSIQLVQLYEKRLQAATGLAVTVTSDCFEGLAHVWCREESVQKAAIELLKQRNWTLTCSCFHSQYSFVIYPTALQLEITRRAKEETEARPKGRIRGWV